jgi:hypothetical protein
MKTILIQGVAIILAFKFLLDGKAEFTIADYYMN